MMNNYPNPEEIGIKQLKETVIFALKNSIELHKQSDIVVTNNPPFSYSESMSLNYGVWQKVFDVGIGMQYIQRTFFL
jgi:hypothetical protein